MFQAYILLHQRKIIESTMSLFSRLRRSDFRSFSELKILSTLKTATRGTNFTDLLADSVAVDDTGKSVGQDKRGAALHQPVQGLLDESLIFGIDCRQRFVKDQNRRVS